MGAKGDWSPSNGSVANERNDIFNRTNMELSIFKPGIAELTD